MSQYGNSPKNPPWARSAGQNMPQSNAVSQFLMANTQVFQGQQAAMGMNMPGLAQTAVAPMQAAMQATSQYDMQMYGAVTYPTRALNQAAFQPGQQAQPQQPPQGGSGQQSGNKQQRVFTGTVTKIQDNFGFVDEDVFFQTSCCVKGSSPQVGDKVLVEAVYNHNMPFKWNATRIQVLAPSMDGGNQGYNRSQGNYNAVPPPRSGPPTGVVNRSGRNRFSSGGGGGGGVGGGGGGNVGPGGGRGDRGGHRMPSGDRRGPREEPDRKRKRDDREKSERAKSPPAWKRSRSPPAKQPRRQRRPPPRYNVTVPRTSLNGRDGDVVEIKKRYANMYIPSDFFLSEYKWTESFPIGKPMSLDFPCSFHVMHKEVDPLTENTAVLEPPDADYIYSAKVMLLASPGIDDLYSKCMILTEERERSKSVSDEDSLQHPSKLINFLVGTRGKEGKEHMAIGGPWSPSLDGENPSSDPEVLVNTAIRTTKALTGIDLSNCTQWFRFVDIHYHRSETTYRGKSYPARVETVVIFVPDVWSCVPTRLEWDGVLLSYQKALARKFNDDDQKDEEEEASVEKDSSEGQTEKVKRDPKHYSELDPKNMKVTDLREELEARNLSPKGLKSQLAARLSKALKSEEEEEEKQKSSEVIEIPKKDTPEPKEDEKKKKEDEEKKKIDEKERQLWEKRYKLPKKPHLIVHPSRTAKSGKFDCSVLSLTSLLGYQQVFTKEHSFEVALFAELFNEMLMRDFGFNIYRALVEAPEKPKEEKEKKDDKEKSKDEKDKEKDRGKDNEKDRGKDNEKDRGKDNEKDKDQKKEKDKDSKNKEKETNDKEPDSKEKDDEMDAESENEDQTEDDKDSKDERGEERKKGEKDKKERVKLITYDKMLLLSFTFFDLTRCGYICVKDIEDLLFSLGLTLSRSQVRKLVSKLVMSWTQDAIYYRRLTDKPENSPPLEHLPLEQLVGNKLILPSYLHSNVVDSSSDNTEVKKGQMITYNGTLVDIGKLMEQLTRSETTRIETERSLGKLRDELSKLKETTTKSEKHIRDLNSDLRDYKERLSSTNADLTTLQIKERQYIRALTEISEKIKPLIAKPEPATWQPESTTKEFIDLIEEKGEEPMTVEEDQ